MAETNTQTNTTTQTTDLAQTTQNAQETAPAPAEGNDAPKQENAPQNAAQRPAAPSQRTQGEPDADYTLIEDDGDLPFNF